MNVIARFDSEDARRRFFEKAEKACPQLIARSFIPQRRPDAVFESLSESEAEALKTLIQGFGRLFDDVEFKPLPSR